MEEVIHADKVFVMDDGKIVMTGTPREIFSQVETLKKELPAGRTPGHSAGVGAEAERLSAAGRDTHHTGAEGGAAEMSIRLEHVNYVYGADTELSVAALKDVCLTIEDGEFVGLIGHTGSGKSTLVQHLNGLLKATDGKIYYNGTNIYEKGYNLKERSRVGLVFQYPEYQLFEIDGFGRLFRPQKPGSS